MTILMLMLTRKMDKEKFLFYSNIYANIKMFINALVSGVVAGVLRKVMHDPYAAAILGSMGLFITISTLDAYLIFKRVKKIRALELSDGEYMIQYIKNTFLWAAIWLLFMLLKYIVKDFGDSMFLAVCMAGFGSINILRRISSSGQTKMGRQT